MRERRAPVEDPGRGGLLRSGGAASGGLILALVSCGGGSLPPGASPEAVQAFSECGDGPHVAKQECYEGHLLAELERSGVRPALDVLAQVATADRDVERDAHVYTHAIGIESYDPDRPVHEVFAECTELYQSGCYHGVIQAHLMAEGSIDEPTVRGLCEAFEQPGADRFLLFQCLHGLGHGLVMIRGHHLPRALADCDLLGSAWNRESCYGGAFMENIVAATNPHHAATELAAEGAGRESGGGHDHGIAAGEARPHEAMGAGGEADAGAHAHEATTATGGEDAGGHEEAAPGEAASGPMAGETVEPFEPLREDDPHYPCSVLDARYLTACYMMQTSVMLWQNGNDIGRAAEDCMDAPEAWRKTCFQSLGRDVSSHTLQDQDDGLRECRKAPAEYREWCYVGLVKNYVDLTATFEDGFAFCRRVEDRYKPRCHQAMGEEIGILRASEAERREACRASERPELERSCLEGARVPVGS